MDSYGIKSGSFCHSFDFIQQITFCEIKKAFLRIWFIEGIKIVYRFIV